MRVLSFVILSLLMQVSYAQPEWELSKEDTQRSIQVFTSSQEDSSYHQFKAVTLVPQNPQTVLAVLSDIPAWPQWLARIKQVKVLKKEKDRSWVYVVYKLPYPFIERDMVVYNQVQSLVTGQIIIKTQALNNYPMAVESDVKRVRLTNFKSTWQLSPLAKSGTKVELWGSGDPEGFVPALIFNYNLPDEPLQSLRQLRKMLLRDKYQKEHTRLLPKS
ncbi:START domain-containing protein [uncultured Agitococcus sp.]|uniref:START domain-containing protein n=1 Tax=uncultured Agitococcus sp. TaxID=1506599 RepID=UPI0026350954|nr:START domain-containing protein [uncultured Agitococcus sp.]